jgi:hypothetical protein
MRCGTSQYRLYQRYFSRPAFERSAIIEEHRNRSCVAMKKEYIESFYEFCYSVTSPHVPLIDQFESPRTNWLNDMGVKTILRPLQGVKKWFPPCLGG